VLNGLSHGAPRMNVFVKRTLLMVGDGSCNLALELTRAGRLWTAPQRLVVIPR
jgi:hypothetical protein